MVLVVIFRRPRSPLMSRPFWVPRPADPARKTLWQSMKWSASEAGSRRGDSAQAGKGQAWTLVRSKATMCALESQPMTVIR